MPRGIPKDPEAAKAKRIHTIERGRSDANVTQQTAQSLQLGSKSRDPKLGARPKRATFSGAMNLDIGEYKLDEDNFRYHMFDDNPRSAASNTKAERVGYEYCIDEQGNNITFPSGSDTMYFMRLPIEWAEEDRKRNADEIHARKSKQASLGRDEYIPDGKSVVVDRIAGR